VVTEKVPRTQRPGAIRSASVLNDTGPARNVVKTRLRASRLNAKFENKESCELGGEGVHRNVRTHEGRSEAMAFADFCNVQV